MHKVKVFNPIYDTVFKYLMEDERVAKVLLGRILDKKIVDIAVMGHEHVSADNMELKLMRIDFAATITEEDGRNETVTIELQKAIDEDEVMRFRKYLGSQYISLSNADVTVRKRRRRDGAEEDYETHRARHIYTIYILGHTIGEGYAHSVMWGETHFKDLDSQDLGNGKDNEFLNGLTHDIYVIQIPYLPERPRRPVERLLRIFDQRAKIENDSRYVVISDQDEELPEYDVIVRRLLSGVSDEQLRGDLDFEDEVVRKLQRDRLDRENLDYELGEARKAIEKERRQKEEERRQKEEERRQKEEERRQKEELIKMVASFGGTEGQIAEKMGVTVEEVRRVLGK